MLRCAEDWFLYPVQFSVLFPWGSIIILAVIWMALEFSKVDGEIITPFPLLQSAQHVQISREHGTPQPPWVTLHSVAAKSTIFCRFAWTETWSLFWKVHLLTWKPGTTYDDWRRSKLSPWYTQGKVVRAETEEAKSDAADGSLRAASSSLKFHALSIAHSNSCWRANPMRK